MAGAAATAPEGRAAAGTWSMRGPAAFLAVFAAALYLRQLFLGSTFVLRDHLVYTWTERAVLAAGLRRGTLPEWNDLVGLGTEFAASSANGVTYPPAWIAALLPLPLSMDLFVALHVLLAGLGTAWLARRLGASPLGAALAGAAFMGSGYVASIAPNKVFAGTAWIPWVAWAADRVAEDAGGRAARVERALAFAGILAAQLLAGDPASSVTGGLVAIAVVLARARRRPAALGALAAGLAGSLPLAAASVLPGLALLPHTTRAALAPGEGAAWSLHPLRLLELLWPRVLGDPVDPAAGLAQALPGAGGWGLEASWSFSVFVSAPVLALAALAAVRRRAGAPALALAAGFLAVLALGEHAGIYGAWRTIFPPERILRYPEKHLAGALVLVCALAGAGLAALEDPAGGARGRRILAAGCALLALPLAAAALLRGPLEASLRRAPIPLSGVDVAAATGVALRAGGIALGVALLASALLLARSRLRLAGAAAVGVLAVHLLYEGWKVTPVASAARLSQVPRLLSGLVPERGAPRPPPRILRSPLLDPDLAPEAQAEVRHETLVLDSPGRFGVAALPGFEGWYARELAALWARVGGMPLAAFQTLYAVDAVVLPSELGRALFPGGPGLGAGVVAQVALDAGADDGRWALVRSEGIRPRAFVAPRWRWAPFDAALAETVSAARPADPGLVLLTGSGAPSPAANATAPLGRCDFLAYRPERVELSCASETGGLAVLVEGNAPGWAAAVDGEPRPIRTADVLLRAVEVGPGRHRVVWEYRTPLLRLGAAVSLFAWLAWLGLRLLLRRRLDPGHSQ